MHLGLHKIPDTTISDTPEEEEERRFSGENQREGVRRVSKDEERQIDKKKRGCVKRARNSNERTNKKTVSEEVRGGGVVFKDKKHVFVSLDQSGSHRETSTHTHCEGECEREMDKHMHTQTVTK